MKKTLVLTLFTLLTTGYAYGAIPVHDAVNTAENHATFLEAAQNTINTATQIANQITNLTSMSPEALLAHAFGVESEIGKISKTAQEAQGLMKSTQNAEEAWGKAFTQVDVLLAGKTSDISRAANNQMMINALDKTYQDTLRTAKINAEIEEDYKSLKEMMEQNKNAQGNKHALQVANSLIAQQTELLLKSNQLLGAVVSAAVADYTRRNLADAEAHGIAEQHIAAIEEDQKTLDNRRRGYL